MLIKQFLRRGNILLQSLLVGIVQCVAERNSSDDTDACAADKGQSRILVVRLDEIGDMVLMSPFLRELRRNCHHAHITLVVSPVVYNLVEYCPYVDHVVCAPGRGRWAFYRNIWGMRAFISVLAGDKEIDLAIVPRFDSDSRYGAGLIAFLTGAKRRVGYGAGVLPNKSVSDKAFDGLYTDTMQVQSLIVRHEVERNLDILHFAIGEAAVPTKNLELWTNEQDCANADRILRECVNDGKRIAVLLSAGRRNKEWPVASYVSVIQSLKRQMEIQVVLLGAGAPADSYGREFCASIPDALNAIGRTTLRESIEVLRRCDCYLGGDTGLMHMAAALGLPGVVLFASNMECSPEGMDTPERFGPWNSKMTVLRPENVERRSESRGMVQSPYIRGIDIEDVKSGLFACLTIDR